VFTSLFECTINFIICDSNPLHGSGLHEMHDVLSHVLLCKIIAWCLTDVLICFQQDNLSLKSAFVKGSNFLFNMLGMIFD